MSHPEVLIAGVGMTRFTKQHQRGDKALVEEAVFAAANHAEVDLREVQAAFCGSVGAGIGAAQRLLKDTGLSGIPMLNLENACASGSTALRDAYAWVKAGLVDCALAFGVEMMSSLRGPLPMPEGRAKAVGVNLPGWYALKARRHMSEYGLTLEQLASVSVKSRQYASLNPFAHFRSLVTTEDVLASPQIADPLTLFQCCPKVDGASAAIVCSHDFARSRGLTDANPIRANALVSGQHVYTDGDGTDTAAARAANLAWEQAGIGPDDINVAECHDAFTIGEILYTEALGLAAPGEGGKLAASGATSLGGDGPYVNPSGGLLSRGHPLGGSGIAQIAEVVWQLRGQAGERQKEAARLGVVHTMGAGELELDANVCAVTVLEAASR